ncbi:CvpA family protein [Blattabacterium cuenoti]|uniref:CvpA family protein n=1 Tax=Blattabacterium cuenoti TaxID=1653831 RepID=UPI00163BD413|nr:CvpA family protein [Blattabacterium cuenoti]
MYNITDIIIVLIFLYSGYYGYHKGFIDQIFKFFILFIILYKGIIVFKLVSKLVSECVIHNHELVNKKQLLFYIFSIYFLMIILIAFSIKKIIEIVFKTIGVTFINNILGSLLGVTKYFIYLSILITFFKEVNKQIHFLPYKYFKNSFEEEFQYIFLIFKNVLIFLLNKMEELYDIFFFAKNHFTN